jgi:hypothetical protein
MDFLGKLKKLPDINPKLFMQLETVDGHVLAAIGEKENATGGSRLQQEEDGGIEFDRGDDEEEDEESDSENGKPKVSKGNKPVKNSKVAAATQQDKETEEDDLNIDDI